VGVDDGFDPFAADATARLHRPQHGVGQLLVEQRIDESGFAARRDQPGVRPAPASVALHPGPEPVAKIGKFRLNRHFRPSPGASAH
jgi:hypothetical protein